VNARLTVVTGLLGSLIVVLSQFVTAYSLEDQFGVNMANVTLLDKHGPLTLALAALAGLALLFLIVAAANAPAESQPVALAVGIVVGGMGLAVILIFLLVDLPDIGDTGMYDAPGSGNLDATGTASAGLWLELVGGVILLLAGAALATIEASWLDGAAPDREESPRTD